MTDPTVEGKKMYYLFSLCLAVVFSLVPSLEAASNSPEAWITNEGDFVGVTTIDLNTRTVIDSVSIDGYLPQGIAITPDNKYVWAVCEVSNFVVTIDASTHTVVGSPVSVGGSPVGIAITPDNTYAWVTNWEDGTVTTIDLNTRTVVGTPISVGNRPFGIAITPDNKYAWVVNEGDNTVVTIDLSTRAIVGSPVPVGDLPSSIVVTPDNKYAWVSNRGSASVTTIDLSTRTTVGSPVSVDNYPVSVAITPDNQYGVVSCFLDNTVVIIDLSTRTVVGSSIPVNTPLDIAITPDSKYAWIASQNNAAVTIDLATRTTVGSPVSFGDQPIGIAISPDQAPTARFSSTGDGFTVAFDASASTSPYGGIATYQWDFGDGSAVETVTSPTISHVYGGYGTYTVTLTVTNTSGTSTKQIFTGQTVSNNGGSSAEVQQQIVVTLPAPQKFHGKAKIYRKAKKLYLHTKWKGSLSSNIVRYEIFAHNKKMLTIPVLQSLNTTYRIYPQHFPHYHLSKRYRRYLQNKYSIRSVDSGGNVSALTPLHVTTRALKSLFAP